MRTLLALLLLVCSPMAVATSCGGASDETGDAAPPAREPDAMSGDVDVVDTAPPTMDGSRTDGMTLDQIVTADGKTPDGTAPPEGGKPPDGPTDGTASDHGTTPDGPADTFIADSPLSTCKTVDSSSAYDAYFGLYDAGAYAVESSTPACSSIEGALSVGIMGACTVTARQVCGAVTYTASCGGMVSGIGGCVCEVANGMSDLCATITAYGPYGFDCTVASSMNYCNTVPGFAH